MKKVSNKIEELGLTEEYNRWKKNLRKKDMFAIGRRVRIKKGHGEGYVYTTEGSEGIIVESSRFSEVGNIDIKWIKLTGDPHHGTPIFDVRKEDLEFI